MITISLYKTVKMLLLYIRIGIQYVTLLIMQKINKEDIEQATERVKKRLPIEKIRQIPKYKNISPKAYNQLIKNAETFSLLILEAINVQDQNII